MTTNQTIDGVPREAVAALEKARDVLRAIIRDKAAGVHYASAQAACHQINGALLDAPAEPKPTGLSQGWNLTRKHDGFVVGHQSVAYPPDEKAIERAERDGYVWVPFLVPAAQRQGEPAPFQLRVKPWLLECFGEAIAADRQERNHRFLEEALELVQSNQCTASEAHQLVDYVYSRPVGEPSQEVGGVMVTLAALCLASGLDMHSAAETELSRIWTKVDQIRAKQAAKPAMSPLPGVYPDREQPAPVAVPLPERKTVSVGVLSESNTHNHGWNACIDELKRLNPSL